MTNATDELRRMLDERGVEYETNDSMGASETTWNGFTAYQLTPTAKLIMHPTPEQAIAATLGDTDEGCYLMRDGTKFPVELDYSFLGIMPITIEVGGFRYLLEVPDGE